MRLIFIFLVFFSLNALAVTFPLPTSMENVSLGMTKDEVLNAGFTCAPNQFTKKFEYCRLKGTLTRAYFTDGKVHELSSMDNITEYEAQKHVRATPKIYGEPKIEKSRFLESRVVTYEWESNGINMTDYIVMSVNSYLIIEIVLKRVIKTINQ